MNKVKTVIALGALVMAGTVMAGPRGCPGFRPSHHHFRPRPCFPHHSPIGRHGGWGRGGCNFWPGFVGGVVGGLVGTTITRPVVVTTPTVVTPAVVTTPVVTQTVVARPVTMVQNVWVEGCYVDQMQANGTVVRVWQPGHYEQRTVTVQ